MRTPGKHVRLSATRAGLCLCVPAVAAFLVLCYHFLVPSTSTTVLPNLDATASTPTTEPSQGDESIAAGEPRDESTGDEATAEPVECDGDGTWDGCRGTGCMVCWEKVIDYDCYFENHPGCIANVACGGEFFDCDTVCSEPSAADRCLDQSPTYLPLTD